MGPGGEKQPWSRGGFMTVIVVSFICCLLVFLGVGIASASRRKNTSDDYLLASRSVGPWLPTP